MELCGRDLPEGHSRSSAGAGVVQVVELDLLAICKTVGGAVEVLL